MVLEETVDLLFLLLQSVFPCDIPKKPNPDIITWGGVVCLYSLE